MAEEAATFMVEGATLIFKNFEGREGPYNLKGNRNFAVILEPALAEQMLRDGWNVKYLKVREENEGEEPTPYISVNVGYKIRPPRIVLITSTNRTHITEENVGIVDNVEIGNADLICRASYWNVNGKSGMKAYLQSLYITVQEDELDRKYATHEDGVL